MTPPAATNSPQATNSAPHTPLRPAIGSPVASSFDPDALLDQLDTFTANRATQAAAAAHVTNPNAATSATPTIEFDAIDFLNRHYTTEQVLVTQLPPLRNAVSDRMYSLDEKISNALQRQSETAEATRRHTQDAKASVESLEKRIRLVQEKASQSERAVLEITKDMKRLDLAKRHLQQTITTLKRLHMLVHAVEQLRLACLQKPFPDYKAASQLVDATRLLLKHFDAYTYKVEPMRLLGKKVTDLQSELRKGLVRGFRVASFGLKRTLELEGGVSSGGAAASAEEKEATTSLLPIPGSPLLPKPGLSVDSEETQEEEEEEEESVPIMSQQVLADGCLLLDALGADSRFHFVKNLCDDHLDPYTQLFAPTPHDEKMSARANSFKIGGSPMNTEDKDPNCLDQVERRFAWYRRLLREVEEKFSQVFPFYWNFHYALTRYFLEETKVHYFALLEGPCQDSDSQNATILLKALQKTILFEKEMMVWLQREHGTVFLETAGGGKAPASPVKGSDDEMEFDHKGTAAPSYSPEGIKIRYERQKKEQEKGGGEHAALAALDEGRASAEQVPVEPLIGIGSSAFDDYLAPYIELEQQSMDEQLVESVSDKAVDARGELPVFTSSTNLFVYIKGSITRCTALTKGRAFFLLYQAFQETLQKYADVLSGKLPVATTATVGLAASFANKPESGAALYRIPPGGEVTVSNVISTCEYCADTVEALQELIRDTIDDEYEPRIDMMEQQDAFHDVIAKSIAVLVSGLVNRIDGALKEMSSTNWATFDMVGEESTYVRSIHEQIEPFVTSVRELVPSSYFRSFCDKFLVAFANAYYDAIIRLKRISEQGTQQLLLDVYNIKTLLMKLPVMERSKGSNTPKKPGTAASTIAPALYTKNVTKEFRRIEALLKLVGTPNELLVDVFKTSWVGGSALDLQTVMILKGMNRPAQAAMFEKFGVDSATALRGAAAGVNSSVIINERVQALQSKTADAATKVNSDLNSMRQKVDDFRRSFR